MSGSGQSSSASSPYMSTFSFEDDVSPLFPSATPDTPTFTHTRSQSATTAPNSRSMIDPELVRMSSSQSQPMVAIEGNFDQNFQQQDSRRQPTSAPFDVRQYRGAFDYPSPTSNFETLNYSNANFPPITADSPQSMPPPGRNPSYGTPSSRQYTESVDSYSNRHKRSHSAESPVTSDAYSPQPGPPTPYSPFMAMPLTPNSSVGPDDNVMKTASKQPNVYPPPDLRRLSVQSLLAGPPGDNPQARQYPIRDEEYTTYGFDLGYPDLDTPRNDDLNAIAIFSPPRGAMDIDGDTPYGRVEPRAKDMAFEKGGYYAEPVPIKISKSLEPLPPLLLESPMNLLYFHHFLNHTARILVPHDCERNPFRQILPESTSKHPPLFRSELHH